MTNDDGHREGGMRPHGGRRYISWSAPVARWWDRACASWSS